MWFKNIHLLLAQKPPTYKGARFRNDFSQQESLEKLIPIKMTLTGEADNEYSDTQVTAHAGET